MYTRRRAGDIKIIGETIKKSRPENRVAVDDDDFLPFAMEKSDFQNVTQKKTDE